VIHPLHLAVGKSRGMRQLGALRVLGMVRDRFPGLNVTVRFEGHTIALEVMTPRRAWWGFGLCHLWIWWEARRVALLALAEVKVDIRLRKVRPWKVDPTSRGKLKRSTRSPGVSLETR
jgi:hypothetical protein